MFEHGLRVGRFLRGLAQHRSRRDDVFISSYPRSGTTWLQQILWVLTRDGDPGFAHIDDVVPWFERSLALGVRTARDFDSLQAPRLFKSHLPRMWIPRGARCVYVVRDGRDVAVSYYELYRSHLGYAQSFDAFFERFMAGRVQYGSWFKHVAGFRAQASDSRTLILDYADLLRDLPREMSRLAAFLGLERSPRRLDALSELCTFSHMKAHEGRFDHATEKRAGRGTQGAFIRQGKAGGHRERFSEAQLARFERACHARPALAGLELDLPAFLR